MARRSARISSRTLSSTPQPIKRVSLSHDEHARAPRTVPAKLASLREIDDIPGSFPQSPIEEHTPSKRVRMSTPPRTATIIPAREEMHPQAHHKTMPEAHADARWLGFSEKEPEAPTAEKTSLPRLQKTPSKATAAPNMSATPIFEFTFQREQSLELSPAAKKMMIEKRDEALRIKEQMRADIANAESSVATGRVIATPKSKRGRFSDAHNEQFQQMDSIAGHASAFRKDPSRLAMTPRRSTMLPTSAKSLKRSPSKADLDQFSATPTKSARKNPPGTGSEDTSPRKRARFESVAEPEIVLESAPPTPSRLPQPATPSRSAARTPLTSSKISQPSSFLSKSPARASIFGGAGSQGQHLLARTPLKPSSAARSQADAKSSSAGVAVDAQTGERGKSFLTPTKGTLGSAGATNKLQERFDKLRATPIKSILRTPQRLYSDDPAKIAAGTHLATPPQRAGVKALRAPATAPVRKHVDFSSSTKAREASKKANVATIFRAGGAQGSIESKASDLAPITYPDLPAAESVAPATSPRRRQSAGPLDFTFRAGGDIVFAPSPTPKRKSIKQSPSDFTIRAVVQEEEPEQILTTASSKKRKMAFENQSSIEHAQLSPTVTLGSKKRKFDYENDMAEKDAEELEDKENVPAERPVKRLKASQSPAPVKSKRAASAPVEEKKRATLGVKPKAMVGKTALKPAAKKAGSTISMARLNALAMPKKR